MKNAVVLWTGGKDSCLALHLAMEHDYHITALVTFVPHGNPEFHAHPQLEMREQAGRMGFDIHFIEINEPYKASYIEALKWIRNTFHAGTVITGDIDLVGGLPNWIEECCEGLEIELSRPLWNRPRPWIMSELLARGIAARITLLNHPQLPANWLNRIIDEHMLIEMKELSDTTGIDLTGENGEYHTMVVEAPAMRRSR